MRDNRYAGSLCGIREKTDQEKKRAKQQAFPGCIEG